MKLAQRDLAVTRLGPTQVPSPLGLSTSSRPRDAGYVHDDERVALDVETLGPRLDEGLYFEKAGPRREIFFDPRSTRAALVTCGGLCPGINNVVRSMVFELHHRYRVADIIGYRYGYEGLDPSSGLPAVRMDPDAVKAIHRDGGSVLGLSRGAHDPAAMVDTLVRDGVDILFTIGGDGTLRGAHAIAEELSRRGVRVAVVGVPKTVDNDVVWVDRTFGFDTAVEIARQAVDAAHTEAVGARNGIGIVKLMGRDAGFITAAATLASRDVNFCLVPEVPFDLGGPHGLLTALERRLAHRGHALIVVAEGCTDYLSAAADRPLDASGNRRYADGGLDVGPYLRDVVKSHFHALGIPITVKYIDPSYMVRSVAANASDAILCDTLARHAVHAGMTGRTDLVIGRWHRAFTHLPLSVATAQRKRIDPTGGLWLAVTEATGQPRLTPPTASEVPNPVPV